MADINIYSIGSKMLICCLKGNLEYCQYLYNNGYKHDISRPNINLRTPLTVSCSMGHLHISKWLYQKGAHTDIDRKDKNGAYPAYCAIREGHLETVKWLYSINKLNNIWQSDAINQLPIWFVCNHTFIPLKKRLEIGKFLITHGIKTRQSNVHEEDGCYCHLWDVNYQTDFEENILKWGYSEIEKFYRNINFLYQVRDQRGLNLDCFIIKRIMYYLDDIYTNDKINNIFKLIEYHKKKK